MMGTVNRPGASSTFNVECHRLAICGETRTEAANAYCKGYKGWKTRQSESSAMDSFLLIL